MNARIQISGSILRLMIPGLPDDLEIVEVYRHPFSRNTFDLVVSSEAIQHSGAEPAPPAVIVMHRPKGSNRGEFKEFVIHDQYAKPFGNSEQLPEG